MVGFVTFVLGCAAPPPAPLPAPGLGSRCDQGDGAACTRIGHLSFDAGQLDDALDSFERGCKAGDADGCLYQAGMLENAGRMVEALALHESQCGKGDAVSCGSLGELLSSPGPASDPERGARLLTQACEGAAPAYCSLVADLAIPDVARAKALYEKSCSAAGWACVNWGNAIATGKLGPPDRTAMLAAYDLGWTRFKDARARDYYATSLLENLPSTTATEETRKAVDMLLESCEHGDPQGCWHVGQVEADGWYGIAANRSRAEEHRLWACQHGWKDACRVSFATRPVPPAP